MQLIRMPKGSQTSCKCNIIYCICVYLCNMNYTEHKDNPKSFHALTSLDHIQFSHLLPYFEASHDDYLSEYELYR